MTGQREREIHTRSEAVGGKIGTSHYTESGRYLRKKRVDDEKSGTKERKEMSVVMYTEVWDINLASDRSDHMIMQSLSLSFLESP